MIKKVYIILIALTAGVLLSFKGINREYQDEKKIVSEKFSIPDNVKEVIFNHCYDCHYTKSKSIKGKKKLKFDAFDGYKKAKLIAKLQDIADVVDEGKMPPEKTIKKYPEMKLSENDAQLLINWANKAMEEVMK